MKNPNKLAIPIGGREAADRSSSTQAPGATTTALLYPAQGKAIERVLILGHGAGAGQHSTFMVAFADALSELGVDVVTFNFLYTEQRRRIPDRPPLLEECFRAVVDAVRRNTPNAHHGLFIGGKSMGGRIATHIAAADPQLPVDGLVLLGYPLHPPGKPDQRRDKHLPSVGRPMLFIQGSRDTFGTPGELSAVLNAITPPPSLHVIDGGDHSFKLSRKDPAAQAAAYRDAQHTIATWMGAIRSSRT